MAGLLQWLVDTGGYYKERQEESRSKQLQGLLAQFQGSQAVSAPGGMGATSAPQSGHRLSGPQGLLAPQGGGAGYLPPQFYQQAGMIPGMEGFLSQDQLAGQQMGRQQQEQLWNRDNMTAAQAGTLAEQQRQFDTLGARDKADIEARYAALSQQAAEADRAFGGLSEYQKRTLQQQADELAAQAAKPPTAPTGFQYNTGGVLEAVPGGKPFEEQRRATAPLDLGLETIDRALKFAKDKGSYESGKESYQLSTELKNDTVQAVQALRQSGALGESELKGLEAMAWDFNDKMNMASLDATAEAQLKALRTLLERHRDTIYQSQNRTPPASWPPRRWP